MNVAWIAHNSNSFSSVLLFFKISLDVVASPITSQLPLGLKRGEVCEWNASNGSNTTEEDREEEAATV